MSWGTKPMGRHIDSWIQLIQYLKAFTDWYSICPEMSLLLLQWQRWCVEMAVTAGAEAECDRLDANRQNSWTKAPAPYWFPYETHMFLNLLISMSQLAGHMSLRESSAAHVEGCPSVRSNLSHIPEGFKHPRCYILVEYSITERASSMYWLLKHS